MRAGPWLAGMACAVALVGVASSPALAHVDAETTASGADGTSTVTFSFEHGCDGAATTALRVAVPNGADVVTTQQPEGWSAEVKPAEIAWTGSSIPDGEAGSFAAVVRYDAPEGEPVTFPAVQVCGDAELAWIDTDPSSSNPAPVIRWAVVGDDGVVETAANTSHGHSGTSTTVIVIGAVIALAVVAAIVYVLVRRRQTTATP